MDSLEKGTEKGRSGNNFNLHCEGIVTYRQNLREQEIEV